jgi:hypothetical protein
MRLSRSTAAFVLSRPDNGLHQPPKLPLSALPAGLPIRRPKEARRGLGLREVQQGWCVMAGDWIKMRSGLATHPKVVRIASALKADRLRVVGGLHSVWCLFDEHSENGVLIGYTLSALDDLIGWPGFSAEMARVEWLIETGETLATPRFEDHNGQSAKRRAQDADRKRMARENPEIVQEMSAFDADKKRTREEKRREEKREEQKPIRAPRFDAQAHLLTLGVDPGIAADWIKLRKGKRAEVTKTAIAGIAREAEKAGYSLPDALRECCSRGWAGFKSEWLERPSATVSWHDKRQASEDATNRAIRDFGKSDALTLIGERA